MNGDYVISAIENVIKIATTLTGSWFRGHSRDVNELTPRVFRKSVHIGRSTDEVDRKLLEASAPERLERPPERDLIEAFKREAPAVAQDLPPANFNADWLFLMQHHGLPTRLLDWSKSALVGLYFAVAGDPKNDGELWALVPQALNGRSGAPEVPTSQHPLWTYIVNEPLCAAEVLGKRTGLAEPPTFPVAIEPSMRFARVASQFSTFTIHPLKSLDQGYLFSV